MSKAVEIINAILTPVNKLIDAVTGAIGKAYEPRYVKKMAEAKAHEINMIGQSLRENADIPIEYSNGEITGDTKNFDEFVKRTQSRMAYQELLKQQNIENVTDKAYDILADETECSDEPVDKDWMLRFFNSVEDISNEDMQQLWAKILAGEVKRPHTFSLRTLETLRNLTQEEANLFEYISKVVVCRDDDCFIPENDMILHKYDIDIGSLLTLSECGIISSLTALNAYTDVPADKKKYPFFYGKNKIINVVNSGDKSSRVSISAYPLSRIGIELFRLFDSGMSDKDIKELIKTIDIDKRKIKIYIDEEEN